MGLLKLNLFLASVHLACLIWFYTFSFKKDQMVTDYTLGLLHHRSSFLTMISFQSNALYYFITAFQKRSNYFSKLYLFLVKVALWVGLMFWAMYYKDPGLVVREDGAIPKILSYTLHGFNIPLIMVPLFITSNKVTSTTFRSDLFEGIVQMVVYNTILQIHNLRFGFQVYPFLNKLHGNLLIKFNLFVVAWSVVFGFLLRLIFFR